jgi:peptide/nickel transport system substrate-binding protein
VNNAALPARGAATPWFGWPEDAKLEELRAAFMKETDEKKKIALAGEVQKRAFEVATHAPLGEYSQPEAGRKSIKGWLTSGLAHTYWNISK